MKFIAFDLETTGIKPKEDQIVEIGAVRFDGSQVVDTFGVLIDPGTPIPYEASAVSGITDDMVAGKPRIESVLPDFAAFCGDLPLVAHNASFDYNFLLKDIEKYRADAPTGVVLDTLSLSRKVFPGLVNYKLGTLVRQFNIPSGTFHRAEEDSTYCGLVFAKIVETLKKLHEPHSEADLVRLSGRAEVRFPKFGPVTDQLDLF